MRTHTLIATTASTLFTLSGIAFAQAPKAEQDHSAHHPASTAPAAAAPATPAEVTPSPQAIDRQMKAMQEMHQKIQAAKTPAERTRLMDEHMKLMQSGMGMMGQMRGGDAGMSGMGMMRPGAQGGTGQPPAASAGSMGNSGGMMGMHMHMERRMAMMEQMMQMMVDREAAKTGK